jgi:DNA-binding NarL/FixJ family response regulator
LDALDKAQALLPDVILMDLKMPRMNGVQAMRAIANARLPCRVIVLTTYDSDDWVFDGVRAGATGYLLKDVSVDDLADAIRAAARGESRLDPGIARKVMDEFRRVTLDASPLRPAESRTRPHYEALTDRESEVLNLIAEGLANKDIATRLFLSEGTVKNHVSVIMSKLQANSRADVVAKAYREGMVRSRP